MVSSKAEYDFVSWDPTDTMIIDGGIMPLRSSQDKRIIRGEDPAHLLEAVAEREYVRTGTQPSRRTMTRDILASRLTGIQSALAGMCGAGVQKAVNWDAITGVKQVSENDAMNASAGQLFNATIDASSLESHGDTYSELTQQPIANLFSDIDTLRYFNTSSSVISHPMATLDESFGDAPISDAYPLTGCSYRLHDYEVTGCAVYSSKGNARISVGSSLSYVDHAKVILCGVSKSNILRHGSDSVIHRCYFACAVNSTISGGDVVFAYEDVVQELKSYASYMGWNTGLARNYGGEITCFYSTGYPTHVVLKLGDHTYHT